MPTADDSADVNKMYKKVRVQNPRIWTKIVVNEKKKKMGGKTRNGKRESGNGKMEKVKTKT